MESSNYNLVPKKIKHGKLAVLLLCITPPLLLVTAGVLLKNNPMGNQLLAKALTYGSFIAICFSLIICLTLLISKKLGKFTASIGIMISTGYAALPIGYVVKNFKEYQQEHPNDIKATLNFFNPNAPHYSMRQEQKERLIKIVDTLAIGEYYISVLHKLPPVPDGCPIIMRTLSTKEIVLSYFIEKKYDGAKSDPNDKHITLVFDKNQSLIDTKKIL